VLFKIYDDIRDKMQQAKIIKWIFIAVAIAMTTACGDGDAGDNNTTAASTWDTMMWDQGQWK
jgi:uncharacterized lipoprotein YajG